MYVGGKAQSGQWRYNVKTEKYSPNFYGVGAPPLYFANFPEKNQ